jgi:DNA-binding HxlR family transcriptional regulator
MLTTSLPFVALAQESEAPQRQGVLIARVAEILGIDQQKLEDALKQARPESAKENLDARLQELITNGTLTQQQADELKTWLNARPDVPMVPPRQLDAALEKGTITQEQVDALKAWQEAKPDIPKIGPTIGERLVDEGIITPQQSDEYKAWMESRPADIPNVRPAELKKLLDEGKITQEQLDKFKAWVKARPDMPKIRPELVKNRAQKIQENRDTLMARVADILGIYVEDLENAFKQAQGELRENALDTRLQELVNQGAWTQQQSDAFKAWIKARPDVPPLQPGRQFEQPE